MSEGDLERRVRELELMVSGLRVAVEALVASRQPGPPPWTFTTAQPVDLTPRIVWRPENSWQGPPNPVCGGRMVD